MGSQPHGPALSSTGAQAERLGEQGQEAEDEGCFPSSDPGSPQDWAQAGSHDDRPGLEWGSLTPLLLTQTKVLAGLESGRWEHGSQRRSGKVFQEVGRTRTGQPEQGPVSGVTICPVSRQARLMPVPSELEPFKVQLGRTASCLLSVLSPGPSSRKAGLVPHRAGQQVASLGSKIPDH